MRTLAKLAWVEVKLFGREPIAVVFAFAFPLVVLLVLAGVFGSDPDANFGGVAGIDYYVPGYLAVVIASVGLIGLPVHLASLRERGVLRRLRASSVSMNQRARRPDGRARGHGRPRRGGPAGRRRPGL
jgi:ABC-2 type transport system permease protein